MGRLIDADVLIERIKEEKEDNDAHCRLCMDATVDIIDSQSTAFDVEAVVKEVERYLKAVEQLECPHDYSDEICERYSYCSKCRGEWLLRIIRKGGVKCKKRI